MKTDSSTPIVLASGQDKPYALTVDSISVYWTNNGDGTIAQVPITGGEPTILATGYKEAAAIIVSGGWLYWSAFGSGNVSKLELARGKTEVPISLAENYIGVGQISLGTNVLCFVVYDGPLVPHLPVIKRGRSGVVATVPITGGAVSILQDKQPSLSDVVLDGADVYWTCIDGVRTMPLGASSRVHRSLFTSTEGYPIALVKSGWVLFWADIERGEIHSISLDTPDVVSLPLVRGLNCPYRLAIDATHLYWTNYTSDGSVMRCPLMGGPPEILASNQDHPAGITLDSENVYWVNMVEDGTVMKLPKPESRAIQVSQRERAR